MKYRLLLDKKRAKEFLENLTEKSKGIVISKLKVLTEDPHPGGNKEHLNVRGRTEYYRLHIGRTFTVFYTIHEKEREVHVLEILTIEQAHKKYGNL